MFYVQTQINMNRDQFKSTQIMNRNTFIHVESKIKVYEKKKKQQHCIYVSNVNIWFPLTKVSE